MNAFFIGFVKFFYLLNLVLLFYKHKLQELLTMNKVEQKPCVIGQFFSCIKNVWFDRRIPTRDRWVIAVVTFLIISPLDIIPDVIPVVGVIDDLILISFVLDYFFNQLEDNVILDHFPFNKNRFYAFKTMIGNICKISPQHMLHFLWKYKKPDSGPQGRIQDAN